jgi:hypothetical protein
MDYALSCSFFITRDGNMSHWQSTMNLNSSPFKLHQLEIRIDSSRPAPSAMSFREVPRLRSATLWDDITRIVIQHLSACVDSKDLLSGWAAQPHILWSESLQL